MEEVMSEDERRACAPAPAPLRRIQVGGSIPGSGDEPSDEELLRLIEGTLSPEQRRRLEARLESCPYSADRVAIVRAVLEEAGVSLPRVFYLFERP